MEITGNIIAIKELEVFKNDFTKRSIVIETIEPYPQKIQIDFIKDNTDHLHGLVLGQKITVCFNIRGREYQGKYYTSIEGWRVKRDQKAEEKQQESEIIRGKDEDDLPF